mgnify:CR=1 FL=1
MGGRLQAVQVAFLHNHGTPPLAAQAAAVTASDSQLAEQHTSTPTKLTGPTPSTNH